MSHENPFIVIMIVLVSLVSYCGGSKMNSTLYKHDTREGTITCEGAESIIKQDEIYCLKSTRDNKE